MGRWRRQTHNVTVSNASAAFKCAELYSVLLGMEENAAYNVFQPLLFDSLLNLLKMWKLSCIQRAFSFFFHVIIINARFFFLLYYKT